jgi:1-pyrroline-5-carboxylate dehydrogenase
MFNGHFEIPKPVNEPVMAHKPGSPERAALQATLKDLAKNPVEIPCVIGGKEIHTGDMVPITAPHDHKLVLGAYHQAGKKEVAAAVKAAMKARKDWGDLPWSHRATIMLKAGELLAGKYRHIANAAAMLGVSKTVHQAEIDAACELIDFWRFNPYYMMGIYNEQPQSTREMLNYMEHRPLEGFVFAVTPFNFVSIAGNLPTSPVLMGNVAVWKPASSAVYPAWFIMKILVEAGMPPGVINFVPGRGSAVGPVLLADPDLGGVHFTGSTAVFADIWKTIGADVLRYKSYPRIVGETGGKDFIFAHASADPAALVANIIRGGFEFQGQKCSAASRIYIPDTLWKTVKPMLLDEIATIKVGAPTDFDNFMCAVVDKSAFRSISGYIDYARKTKGLQILAGGTYDDAKGYYIQPTVVLSKEPQSKLMVEEIFGPVVTIYVYPEKQYAQTLKLCDATSPYALTGAIFARDRAAIVKADHALRQAAGNFYVNDKPTGAVVGQQPFGGARASGTNDKAGSRQNLMRWTSPRSMKEVYVPATDYRYPFLAGK